jgi:hypothetical protein
MKRRCIANHYQSRRPEKDMTIEHIAMLIAAHIIVLIILWAPLLDFIGPPCVRFLQRRREQKASSDGQECVEALLPSKAHHRVAIDDFSDLTAIAIHFLHAPNMRDKGHWTKPLRGTR